jgi:hypothetical protein
VADGQIAIAPLIPVIAVENRRFLARPVTWVANQGVAQFIDLKRQRHFVMAVLVVMRG